jgi:hypothetical protein
MTEPVDPLTAATAHGQASRGALIDLLRRVPSEAPPAHARSQDRSFDGGCRRSVPVPRDPLHDHNLLLGQLLQLSRVFRGGSF